MRHLLSLIAGLVIAPVAWVLTGLGQAKLSGIKLVDGEWAMADWGFPLGLLAAAGLLIGLIAATKVSPLGPTLAGLIFLAAQGVFVWDRALILDNTPNKILGEEGVVAMPAGTGLAAVLGVAMLVSVFSIARWRSAPREDDLDAATAPPNDLFGASRPSLATSAAAENRNFPSTYQPLGGYDPARGGATEATSHLAGRRGTTYGGETEEEGEDTVRINSDSGTDTTKAFTPTPPSQPASGATPPQPASSGAPLWPNQGGQSGGTPWPSTPPASSGGTDTPGAWPPPPSGGQNAPQNPWSQSPGGA